MASHSTMLLLKKMRRSISLTIILLFFVSNDVFSQAEDTTALTINRKGLRKAVIISSVTYASSIAALNHLWYRHADKQSFRFFNDNAEWKQMDKLGHAYSSFYLSYGISRGLQHYRVPEGKADLIGSLSAFAALIPIEVFDGHSTAYGASTGDLIANATGPLLYLAQKRLWNEVRILPKYSFHTTRYAAMRPEVLGRGAEQIIKDYNGQTFWLSADVDKFIAFPKWLNIAVGYGAERMVYARDSQHTDLPLPFRQYYLSIDFDLTSIPTRSRVLKAVFFMASMVKLPAPTIEWSQGTTKFHPLYF